MNLFSRIKKAARVLAGTYYGASSAGNNRQMYGFSPDTTDGSREIFAEGRILRARSRDLVRQDSHARAIVEGWQANLIGSGVVPRSKHPDPAVRDRLHELFEEQAAYMDADGISDFYGQQAVWAAELVEGGEVFIRIRQRRNEDGLPLPFQLQTIPAEQVPEWKQELGTNGYIRGGVEFDALGRRVAYHIYRDHPASGLLNAADLRRVPATDGTMPLVLHLFVPRRAAQVRGEPWLAPVISKLHDLHKYQAAKLQQAKAASYFLGSVVAPGGNPLDYPMAEDLEDADTRVDSPIIEPCTILRLDPGEKLEFNETPADPNYAEFVKSNIKTIARGVGLTYAAVSGDTREANFSSMRADEMISRRKCKQIQQLVLRPVLNEIWNVFLWFAVMAGKISASDYRRNKSLYERIEWRFPAFERIQPQQDVEAEIAEIRAGLKTREEAVAERGYDIEEIDRQNAQDQERCDELELTYDSDGRQPKSGGTTPEANGGDAAAGDQQTPVVGSAAA